MGVEGVGLKGEPQDQTRVFVRETECDIAEGAPMGRTAAITEAIDAAECVDACGCQFAGSRPHERSTEIDA